MFLFYHQLKLEPGLQLHRMMSPKVDDIVELFNTVLADLSIEEARNQQAHERHIIVMPDLAPMRARSGWPVSP